MYSQHELSALFPSMGGDEFAALVADIRANGLRHPVVLYEGKVLDGWHRYRACNEAGVHPQIVAYKGSDPLALVLSENMHRRHLSSSQRALIVVEANEWRGRGRITVQSDDKSNLPRGRFAEKATTVQDVATVFEKETLEKTDAQMAAEAETSERTIARAKVVATQGSAALKDAVREGEATVKAAAEIAASTPKKNQAKALKERRAPKEKAAAVPNDEHAKLVAAYADLLENRDDLAAELEAVESFRANEHVIKIKQLQFELRACRRARDDQMAQVHELTKSANYWKRKFEKAAK